MRIVRMEQDLTKPNITHLVEMAPVSACQAICYLTDYSVLFSSDTSVHCSKLLKCVTFYAIRLYWWNIDWFILRPHHCSDFTI